MSLVLTNITLTYPDGAERVTALDRVSLTVPDGTVAAVVGPSGSGKSSLLAVAATLVRPDAGTVEIGGRDVTLLDDAARTAVRRTHVGVVFQQPNLLASLTALEQLEVMAVLDGRKPAAVRARAMELLDAVGLADQARRRPHQLSGGQRQRVNIARALVSDPAVLLVDEPTSALDHERGAAVLDLVVRLAHEQEVATVLVTHDHSQLGMVDEVHEMRDGRLAQADLATTPASAPTLT
ncbi:ABC transporter ATP-binding protein [Sanguibacter sp. HDW7]|uniref:ABC transporter ATP-binding protein n=1 Tax=Sanguibacter sp. HDW7 TaxID=2714931 RepID=UPI0014082655|nr:ABC transporter ATP-binding protein [Sanguibacter sp. HDW7]QIK82219.1 ABC transporter ATP-binding protein [Sanguibacter sp. HDW7]